MTYRPLAVGNGTTFDTVGDPRIGAAAGDIPEASVAGLTASLAAKLGTLTVNAQTGTTYTLTTTDPQKVVTMTNAAASAVTVPTNAAQAVTIGSQIEIVNLSTGVRCTVAPAGGVTLHGGSVALSPGSSVTLAKIGTDVWMVQGQGAPGLTLLATATASAASSVSINGCFTAAYDNYRILYRMTGTTADALNMRMRVSAADNSSANYARQRAGGNSSVADANQLTAQTAMQVGNVLNADSSWGWIDILSPAVAVATLYTAMNAKNVTTPTIDSFSGAHNVATAYDGFTIYPATGTITTPTNGIRVYGYRNA